jgi:hypothetical protein
MGGDSPQITEIFYFKISFYVHIPDMNVLPVSARNEILHPSDGVISYHPCL